MTSPSSLKILIVDKDETYRRILTTALDAIDYVRVIGKMPDYRTAFNSIACLSPHIVVLDYEMPGMEIRQAIHEIKKINNDIEIILVSEIKQTSSQSSVMALELGALYFVRKPKDNTIQENIQYFNKYLKPIINLYRINCTTKKVHEVSRTIKSLKSIKAPTTLSIPAFLKYDIVAIGCSLGGPKALKQIIPLLPADFPIPIVITQHMPAGFTAAFSSDLDAKSQLIVMEAQGGEQLQAGYVYIAKGGKHMLIRHNPLHGTGQYIIRLDDGPFVHGCKPAVDVMLKSLDKSFTGNILMLILTGMGEDGLEGVRILKKKNNNHCITQDEKSSVVYGMPGAVAEAGLSDFSVPLNSIAATITNIACQTTTIAKSR